MSTLTPGRAVAVASVALVAGALLLAATLRMPPIGLCDPPIGLAHVLFAVAHGLVALALGLILRAGIGRLLTWSLVVAWSLAAGCVLALREAAGDFAALRASDFLLAGGMTLCIVLVLGGLALKMETARPLGTLLACVLAAVLALGFFELADGVPEQRVWQSWAALDAVEAALLQHHAASGQHLMLEKGTVADVAPGLPPGSARSIPLIDGWNRPIVYESVGPNIYRIASLGAGGQIGPFSIGPSRDFADDLVRANGEFVAWPESPCTGEPRKVIDPMLKDLRAPSLRR